MSFSNTQLTKNYDIIFITNKQNNKKHVIFKYVINKKHVITITFMTS